MSTLDQAFIRAYTKDRRSANASASDSRPTAPNSSGAASPNPTTTSHNQTLHRHAPAENTNSSIEGEAFEPSKWYRFDGAIKQHVRHQPAADGINQTTVTTYHVEDVKQVTPPTPNSQTAAATPRTPANAPANPAATTGIPNSGNKSTDRQSLASYLEKSHLLAHTSHVKNADSATSKVDYVDWTEGVNFVDTAADAKGAPANVSINPSETYRQPAKTIHAPERDRSFETWRVDTLSESLAAPHTAIKSNPRPEQVPHVSSTTEDNGTTNDTHRTFSGMGIGKFSNLRVDSPESSDELPAGTKLANEPFQAVWEVDQLIWPEVHNQLFQDEERAFSKVAAHLSDACRQGLRVLAVTSPSRGEGRSTVAGCLARCVAQRGLKVALLDGDLESPSLADSLNLEVARGWSDAILEGLPLEEVAVQSIEDQLTLIPLLTAETTPHIAPTDRRITAMIQRLRESFDLIIVDATHINSIGSRMIGTDNNHTLDAIIMVKDSRNEDKARVDMAIRRIKTLGVSSVGIVENFSRS